MQIVPYILCSKSMKSCVNGLLLYSTETVVSAGPAPHSPHCGGGPDD